MRLCKKVMAVLLLAMLLLLSACGTTNQLKVEKQDYDISSELTYASTIDLKYAKGFTVYFYEDGYELISISEVGRFLLIPEGKNEPEDLEDGIVIIERPIDDIYLAASAVMDMFVSTGSMDLIRFSGLKPEGWYIEEAKKAMEDGRIEYAGKYNAPDYEKLLDAGCKLAIESTMIGHCPEVKEKLETLGITALTDRSSYETHPLGKTEWVKLYGVISGHTTEAQAVFDEQKDLYENLPKADDTRKSVAFFYITSNGMVNVRKTDDYVPKMIEMAGGHYIFDNLKDDKATSAVNLQLEEFYATAKDADYLIYNSTTQKEMLTKEDLLDKSELLEDFKAYKDGNLYMVSGDFYHESMNAGTFTKDLYIMLHEENEGEEFKYLSKIE